MKKYKEILIEEVSEDELDLESPFYDGDERNEIDSSELGDIWSESPSIDIDEVIKILSSLKEKGANRVYLFAHSDHHGYIITGVKLVEL